jgi:hypothetical protein
MNNLTKTGAQSSINRATVSDTTQPGVHYGVKQVRKDLQLIDGHGVPPKFAAAVKLLAEMLEGNGKEQFADCMTNETTRGVTACRAAFRLARWALDTLEPLAAEVLDEELQYHRDRVAENEALGPFSQVQP